MRVQGRVFAAVLAAGLMAAPAAQAARVDDGATQLRFDRQALGAIKRAGVKALVVLPGEPTKTGATLPVTGGNVSPGSGRGFISHRGAIGFVRGKRAVTLAQVRVSLRPGGRVTARLGSSQSRVTVARLSGTPQVTAQDAVHRTITGLRARFTRSAAASLNRALGVKAFSSATPFAAVTSELQWTEIVITRGYTAVTPDSGTVETLRNAGIAVGPNKGTRTGTLNDVILPIVSGVVGREGTTGRIRHAGGFTFSNGTVQVTIANLNADLGLHPVLTALTAGGRITAADLTIPADAASIAGARLTVQDVGVALDAEAAAALNQAFATTVFTAGMPLGTAITRAVLE